MEVKMKKKKTKSVHIILLLVIAAVTVFVTGCENEAQSKALIGTGIGALAGQAIGGNTSATLIGAGVGAGAGYMIGNEQDKKKAEQYNYNTPTPLTGTKWKVKSLVMDDKPQYESITVEFQKDGKVVSTRIEPGGTKVITEEKYRVVGQVLIIHRTDYIINAKYEIYGNELIVDAEDFRAVLQRI